MWGFVWRAGLRCWAANGKGGMQVLDLAGGKLQGALKGAAGCVRALALHPDLPLLASVGLDRFLRVHNTATRKLLAKVYLKQQLTGGCPAILHCVLEGAQNNLAGCLHSDDGEVCGDVGSCLTVCLFTGVAFTAKLPVLAAPPSATPALVEGTPASAKRHSAEPKDKHKRQKRSRTKSIE